MFSPIDIFTPFDGIKDTVFLSGVGGGFGDEGEKGGRAVFAVFNEGFVGAEGAVSMADLLVF